VHKCKDCAGPVVITRNQERLTLPQWHVSCSGCPVERNVDHVDAPTANGVQLV